MDEEYVQEHILTGGIVAPVGGASPSDSWPLTAIFVLGVGGGGIHGVPGPLAGAGLPFNAIGYGIYWPGKAPTRSQLTGLCRKHVAIVRDSRLARAVRDISSRWSSCTGSGRRMVLLVRPRENCRQLLAAYQLAACSMGEQRVTQN